MIHVLMCTNLVILLIRTAVYWNCCIIKFLSGWVNTFFRRFFHFLFYNRFALCTCAERLPERCHGYGYCIQKSYRQFREHVDNNSIGIFLKLWWNKEFSFINKSLLACLCKISSLYQPYTYIICWKSSSIWLKHPIMYPKLITVNINLF